MIEKQTLYIVGNGFDLYHWDGLQPDTSYQCFRDFLKQNNSEAYDLFSKYFPLNGTWGNFEEALAELDTDFLWDGLRTYINDIDPHRSGDASWEVKRYVDLLTVEMPKALKKFISGESEKNVAIQYPHSVDKMRLNLPDQALYLSFNYTNTLERYYNIPASQICYIHGRASTDDDLIIGHGVELQELERSITNPIMPEGLTAEQEEAWYDQMSNEHSWSLEIAEEELEPYWRKSFKDTAVIIGENQKLFNSCVELNKIVVMGHSLSEVDMPYFEEIIKKARNQLTWEVSFYSDEKKQRLENALLNLGVSKSAIAFFKLQDRIIR